MKIYTASYKEIPDFPKDFALFNIARYQQKGTKLPTISWFVPSAIVFKKLTSIGPAHDIEKEELYKKEILEKINMKSFTDLMNFLSKRYDNIVLLCHEPFGQFCHRHVVTRWLKKQGYDARGEYEVERL